MRLRILAVLTLAAAALACPSDDSVVGGRCPSGKTCGFYDHKYFSEYTCGAMSVGFSWRDLSDCVQQCGVAANWGCDAASCESLCAQDHGTGAWLPCNAANNAEERADGCFLPGSGLYGETVPCACN